MVVRTFSKSIIESFHQNFVVLSKDLVKRWDKHANNPDEAFDMYDSLARISMEVASSTYCFFLIETLITNKHLLIFL